MIKVDSLKHTFTIGKKGKENRVEVLKGINFNIESKEIVAIVGKSGSGKSTLLQILAGFLKADSGSIIINNTEIAHFSEKESAAFRMNHFGFVFQNFQLLPGQTVFENIELPLKLKGIRQPVRKRKYKKFLKRLD